MTTCKLCRQPIDTTERVLYGGEIYHGYCWDKAHAPHPCEKGHVESFEPTPRYGDFGQPERLPFCARCGEKLQPLETPNA